MATRPPWLPLVVSSLLVAGCFGGTEGAPASATEATSGSGATNTTAPMAPPGAAVSPSVSITNHTSKVSPSSPKVNASWRIELGTPNLTLAAGMTVLAWADRPVPQPAGPASYGNESGRRDNVTVPGGFSTSFKPERMNSTTLYFRAFAEVNGTLYWSAEASAAVEVKPPGTAPPSANRTYDVFIAKNVPGVMADYDPLLLQIKVGDSVRFTNRDSLSHTATDRLATWDTGAIGGGANATLQFKAVGRYAYHCTIHAGMVGALLEVSAR